jgi:hypothetical protein
MITQGLLSRSVIHLFSNLHVTTISFVIRCELITQRKAPLGATVPDKVEMAGLFVLDVDDTIWQDVGLADEDLMDPPLWMCDDDVQRGIKAHLELGRCLEEEAHLVHERCALQVWFSEEWKIVMEVGVSNPCDGRGSVTRDA